MGHAGYLCHARVKVSDPSRKREVRQNPLDPRQTYLGPPRKKLEARHEAEGKPPSWLVRNAPRWDEWVKPL